MEIKEQKNLHDLLSQGVQDLHLPLPTTTLDQLIDYLVLLNKWNRVYNLTAIKEPPDMLTRHILDSLSIASYLNGNTIIDVGSGAGLPGIPLALCFPEKKFILLDSNNKKTRFLTQAVAELNITNAKVIHSRVESLDLGKSNLRFDCILTRAFAPLNAMIASTRHLCSPNSCIFAMCGVYPSQEELELITDWSFTVHPLQVPNLREQRHLVLLKEKLTWVK